jgi:hypothetical protein
MPLNPPNKPFAIMTEAKLPLEVERNNGIREKKRDVQILMTSRVINVYVSSHDRHTVSYIKITVTINTQYAVKRP